MLHLIQTNQPMSVTQKWRRKNCLIYYMLIIVNGEFHFDIFTVSCGRATHAIIRSNFVYDLFRCGCWMSIYMKYRSKSKSSFRARTHMPIPEFGQWSSHVMNDTFITSKRFAMNDVNRVNKWMKNDNEWVEEMETTHWLKAFISIHLLFAIISYYIQTTSESLCLGRVCSPNEAFEVKRERKKIKWIVKKFVSFQA